MATKPTNAATWDSNSTNLIAPTAGHKTDGFAVDEVPSSSEVNGQLQLIGNWTNWLLDSQLNDGTANYALTANVTGADPAGTGNLTNIHTVYVTPTTDWEISGIVGGVDKQEIRLINIGTEFIWFQHEASGATAANRITMPTHWVDVPNSDYIHLLPGGSIRLRYHGATSRWKLVDATGFRRLQRVIVPANMIGYDDSLSTHTMGAGFLLMNSATEAFYPVSLPIDSVIYGWKVYLSKGSSGAFVVSAQLYKLDGTTNTENVVGAADTDTTAAPGEIVLEITPSNIEEIISSEDVQYYIKVSTANTASLDAFFHAIVYAFVPQ